ncbi:MAG: DUF4175 domain-containing protein [Bacteroidetes bacterium]|nr:DUF4175 domain-containing protein [Bacteroidota bacterium]
MSGIKGLSNYDSLLKKLDEFTRKYYWNKVIKGSIISVSLILLFFLSVSLLEYFGRFSSVIRGFLFYGLIGFNVAVLYLYFISPILHFFKLGRLLSNERAAFIVGKHFPEVQDKLLNTLQLKSLFDKSEVASEINPARELLVASIDYKIKKLKPIRFTKAIDLSKNKKYLKYAAIPLSFFLIILLSSPNLIKDGSFRLYNYNKEFVKPSPFEFSILNEDLSVIQFSDFELAIKVTGSELPNEVYIEIGNNKYKLKKEDTNNFLYKFKNVQSGVDFRLSGSGLTSEEYSLNVLPKPMLLKFDVTLDYPAYTKKSGEVLQNVGDLIVPAGTHIKWTFFTENTDNIHLHFNNSIDKTEVLESSIFKFGRRFFENEPYTIIPSNEVVNAADSIQYFISVIPDLFPSIDVSNYRDSINSEYLFFTGEVSDDYGFKYLYFRYSVSTNEDVKDLDAFSKVPINIGRESTQEGFFFNLNMLNEDLFSDKASLMVNSKNIVVKPGEIVKYYFEIWDNDGINGSKFTRSALEIVKTPTLKELEKISDEANDKIKEELKESFEEAKELQENINALREKILQKKSLSWEDKKALNELINKQKSLQDKLENLHKMNEEHNKQQSKFKEQNEDILEKQEQLQELMEELLSDEMKKLLEEMEKLLENMDKEDALDNLEDMDMSNEELSKELDRMLELFKKLELEQKIEETIEKLEELAEQQEELSEQTEDRDNSKEELGEKQEELNKEFEDIKEDLDEIEKMNEELEQPNNMENTEQEEQEIEDEMENSSDELKKGNRSKAGKSQKKASDKMEKMAQQMEESLESMQMEQLDIDMSSVRQILENLMKLSFDQEQLLDDLKDINFNDPAYLDLVQKQHQLKNEAKLVEDSLFSLSKRLFQIEHFVTQEMNKINRNLSKSQNAMEARNRGEGVIRQQSAMTSMNNLALIMDETLQQLQQQMANKSKGSQMCQKPGGKGSPKMSKLRQMQEEINKGLIQAKKSGGEKMSKKLAELAAKQAALRNALQKVNAQENKDGEGSLGDLDDLMKEMDKSETDIVNKRITDELIKRQRDILTRLLFAEKAEKERELSPERISESSNEENRIEPPSFEEYKKMKEKQLELFKTLPPSLKPYYKKLVENYFKDISY